MGGGSRKEEEKRSHGGEEGKRRETPKRKPIKTMLVPMVLDTTLRTMINENPSEIDVINGTSWSCVPPPTLSGRDPVALRRSKSWEELTKSSSWCRRGWNIMREPKLHRDTLEYVSTKQAKIDSLASPQWCSVNEPVEIDVVVRNPLEVELVLRDIVLSSCVLMEGEEEGGGGGGGGGGVGGGGRRESDSGVETKTIDVLVLKPRSDTKMRMRVIPRREGVLTIEGVEWRLCPSSSSSSSSSSPFSIACLHKFDLPGRRLYDTRDQRATGAFL